MLFVDRTPLSEACRGVVTTLNVLGLGAMLREAVRRPSGSRLGPLRAWFSAQDSADYLERIFQVTKLKYAISEKAGAHTYIPYMCTCIHTLASLVIHPAILALST